MSKIFFGARSALLSALLSALHPPPSIAQPTPPTPSTLHEEAEEAEEAEESLLLDLTAVVSYQGRLDWASDQSALTAMAPRLIELACGAPRAALAALQARLAAEVARAGSVEGRWRAAVARGEAPDLDDYADDLERERVLSAARYAEGRLGECPFWRPPRAALHGVHRDAGRVQLVLETMGSAQLVLSGGDAAVGGAGQGRALGVWGATLGVGLGAGLEVGGASTFPKDERGQRSVKAMWSAGLPLIARWWVGNLRLDTEVALVGRFPDGDLRDALVGYRVAQGVGVSTLRVAGLLPHFMLWAGYESYSGSAPADVVRVGTRVGVSWGGE